MNNQKNKSSSRKISLYGLFIALVYISTVFIQIPGPTSGTLFHLGNVTAFTIAIIFGKKAGAISSGFGMALYDLTSPYVIWAPFTFIIRFAMGYVLGFFSYKTFSKKINTANIIIGLILSSIIMIVGYYIAEAIIYGNILLPIQSIWANTLQCIVGSVASIPISISIKYAFIKRSLSMDIQ